MKTNLLSNSVQTSRSPSISEQRCFALDVDVRSSIAPARLGRTEVNSGYSTHLFGVISPVASAPCRVIRAGLIQDYEVLLPSC